MTAIPCAYCGKPVAKPDREHVFPKCLYPPSKATSRAPRLTVPSCMDCNRRWQDDETHFRNVLVVAGEPNAARRELFEGKVSRSFDKIDGTRRWHDLISKLKPVTIDAAIRYKIYPGEDDRVIRIVRKAIKGLCYYHEVLSPVPDHRIWVDVLKHAIPPEFLDQMGCHHREQDIVEYRYQVLNEPEINSVWLITFFERVPFIGVVSASDSGFSP